MLRQATTRILGGFIAALLLGGAMAAWSCSVPVFRYALERWPPDYYGAVLFHKGPLSESQQTLLEQIDPDRSTNAVMPNLVVKAVDLDAQPDDKMAQLWESLQADAVPWLVLLYPVSSGISPPAWSGPFNEDRVKRLVDSPLRRDLARRLVQGDSAVWVLLESGSQEQDDQAADFLERRLQHLEKELQIPTLAEEDVALGLVSASQADLKVAFSLVRLARDNPAEAVLVQLLLGSERDLNGLSEPMAFPIFGRGRALFALVGKGINEDVVDEAAAFLVGPCSCQVKELNPGVDLLMTVDWDGLVYSQLDLERELPPLTGLAGLGEAPESPAETAQDPEKSPTDSESAADTESAGTMAPSPPAPAAGPSRVVLPRLLLVGTLGLVLVGGFTLVILLRK